MAAVIRLLTLIALLTMPFGMAAAPAAAGHDAMAAMPTEHCPDGAPADDNGGSPADCAMPCSAALPATSAEPALLEPQTQTAADPSVLAALTGIALEIATPPPKQA